jgi:hypothetical protein
VRLERDGANARIGRVFTEDESRDVGADFVSRRQSQSFGQESKG